MRNGAEYRISRPFEPSNNHPVDQLTLSSDSAQHTIAIGRAVAHLLGVGDLLALEGQLGAGKTQFVRGVAQGLGLDDRAVSSPTFVIVNEYTQAAPGTPPHPIPLAHVDAYRLAGPDDLDSIGWDRFADGSAVVVVEWASRIARALGAPGSYAQIQIEHTGPESRALTLTFPASWSRRPGWHELNTLTASPSSASSAAPRTTSCPTCGQPVTTAAPDWPFDSPRCRLADLNKWLSGAYSVSRPLTDDDIDEGTSQTLR